MNDPSTGDLELAAFYALNPPLGIAPSHAEEARAVLERVTAATEDGGFTLCWSLAVSDERILRPELVFWCLQVLLSTRQRLSLQQVLALSRSPQTSGHAPGYVKNKAAQLIAELVVERYPLNWPNAVVDLLQALDADAMLRFLRALHEQVLAREAQRHVEASRLKEAMRADGSALLLLDWWAYLLRAALQTDAEGVELPEAVSAVMRSSGEPKKPGTMLSTTELVVGVLELLADYAFWMDLSAILERFQQPLLQLVSNAAGQHWPVTVVSAAVTALERMLLRKVAHPGEKVHVCKSLHLVELVMNASNADSDALPSWSSLLGSLLMELLELYETSEATVSNWAANALRTLLDALLGATTSPTTNAQALLFSAPVLSAMSSLTRRLQTVDWDALSRRLLTAILQHLLALETNERDTSDAATSEPNGVRADVPLASVHEAPTLARDQVSDAVSQLSTSSDDCSTEIMSVLGHVVKRSPTLVLETLQQLPARRLQARLLLELASSFPENARELVLENARQVLSDPVMDLVYFDVVARFGAVLLPKSPPLYAYVLPMLVSSLQSESTRLREHAANTCVRLVQALRDVLPRDPEHIREQAGVVAAAPVAATGTRREPSPADSGIPADSATRVATGWKSLLPERVPSAALSSMLIQNGRFRVEYLLHHFQDLVHLDGQDPDLNLVQLPLVECISLLISSEALSADTRLHYLESCLVPMHSSGLFRSASGLRAVLHLSKGFSPAQCQQDVRLSQIWLTCLDWVLEAAPSPAYGLDADARPLLHRLAELLSEPQTGDRIATFIETRLELGREALPLEQDLQALVLLENQLCDRFQTACVSSQRRLFEPLVRALLSWFPLLPADAPAESTDGRLPNVSTSRGAPSGTPVLSEEARERYTLRNLFYTYLGQLLNNGLASIIVDDTHQGLWPCLLHVVVAGAVGIHFQSIELVAHQWQPTGPPAMLPEPESAALTRAALSVLRRFAEHWAGSGTVPSLDAALLQALPELFRCAPAAVCRENVELQIVLLTRLPQVERVLELILEEATSRGCAASTCMQYLRILSQFSQLRRERERRGSAFDGIDSKQTAAVLPLLRQLVQTFSSSDTDQA